MVQESGDARMTDAPTRIWAWPHFDGWITGDWSANTYHDDRTVEYILAAEHDRAKALQAQLAEAREQRDRAIALAEKAQDRLIEAMDRVDEARDKALDDAAMVADCAPYQRGGIVCGCSEGLAGWTAAAIRAMKGERG